MSRSESATGSASPSCEPTSISGGPLWPSAFLRAGAALLVAVVVLVWVPDQILSVPIDLSRGVRTALALVWFGAGYVVVVAALRRMARVGSPQGARPPEVINP